MKELSGTVVHACNINTLEAEAGGLLWVQGQMRLNSEILSQNMIRSQQKRMHRNGYYRMSRCLVTHVGHFWTIHLLIEIIHTLV